MCDPDRFDRVIEKLWAVWKTQPDMRLGQLLVNVIRPSQPCPQIFGVEDAIVESKLDKYPDPNAPGTRTTKSHSDYRRQKRWSYSHS